MGLPVLSPWFSRNTRRSYQSLKAANPLSTQDWRGTTSVDHPETSRRVSQAAIAGRFAVGGALSAPVDAGLLTSRVRMR